MIATITLNPSIDICYYMDEFQCGSVNRCNKYIKTAGGKGINVSKVLKKLGSEVIATGFLGGATGQFIEDELLKMAIVPEFIRINDDTRNCIAIISNDVQTEILESGPNIDESESKRFIRKINSILDNKEIKVICASGSIPESLEIDYYSKLIEITKKRGIKFVLDTSAGYLKEAIKSAPFLIKPNITELEDFMNIKIQSEKDLVSALKQLSQYGIEIIVVSLGKHGCVAICKDKMYKVTIPEIEMKSPVGSGDAMVAGMLREIDKDSDYEEILRVGSTCGVLNAMNERTGNIDINMFNDIYGKIKVEMIK